MTFVIALMAGCLEASAGECTEIINGPKFKTGQIYTTNRRSLSSIYKTATGANAKTYFPALRSLSSAFAPDSSRSFGIMLMEYDWTGSNDKVKYYTGTFNGRLLADVILDSTLFAGNIEAEGDSTSELFLKLSLSESLLDGGPKETNSFFDYQLCQE